MEMVAKSSARIVPWALEVTAITSPGSLARVTVKVSSASISSSPSTSTVMVFVVSPALKVRVPPGMVKPAKSVAMAPPGPPAGTCQAMVPKPLVAPRRVTVKV